MPGYSDNKVAVQNRLRRIEGQVRGLQRMVEDHLGHCVAEAMAEGGAGAQEKVAEASAAIARLVRA